jgi:hypothetical protein
MNVFRAFVAELWKMFAADLLLTLGALACLFAVALGLRAHWLGAPAAPLVLGAAILGVLVLAVTRATLIEITKRSKT